MEHIELSSKHEVVENWQADMGLYLNFANSMVNYFLIK